MTGPFVKFMKWKRIFLSYICSDPEHCLDGNEKTKNCFYCSNMGNNWKEEYVYVDDDDIKLVPYYGCYRGDISLNRRRRGWSSVALKMHPLIQNGTGYWISCNTILVGYTLKNSSEIFRPIFSNVREELLSMVRHDIKKYVGKPEEGINCIGNGFIRRLRQNIAKKCLLGIQPLSTDVIIHITSWL